MSAVIGGKTQKEILLQLLRLLIDKFEEKELDYYTVRDLSEKSNKLTGWEAVEIVFKPKEG